MKKMGHGAADIWELRIDWQSHPGHSLLFRMVHMHSDASIFCRKVVDGQVITQKSIRVFEAVA